MLNEAIDKFDASTAMRTRIKRLFYDNIKLHSDIRQ